MKPIDRLFPASPDPEGLRKAYVLGYRAGYEDGLRRCEDTTQIHSDLEKDPIEAMKLSSHAYNCLHRYGYRQIGEITKLPAEKIRTMKGMGKKTTAEIAGALKDYGITDTEWDYVWRIYCV